MRPRPPSREATQTRGDGGSIRRVLLMWKGALLCVCFVHILSVAQQTICISHLRRLTFLRVGPFTDGSSHPRVTLTSLAGRKTDHSKKNKHRKAQGNDTATIDNGLQQISPVKYFNASISHILDSEAKKEALMYGLKSKPSPIIPLRPTLLRTKQQKRELLSKTAYALLSKQTDDKKVDAMVAYGLAKYFADPQTYNRTVAIIGEHREPNAYRQRLEYVKHVASVEPRNLRITVSEIHPNDQPLYTAILTVLLSGTQIPFGISTSSYASTNTQQGPRATISYGKMSGGQHQQGNDNTGETSYGSVHVDLNGVIDVESIGQIVNKACLSAVEKHRLTADEPPPSPPPPPVKRKHDPTDHRWYDAMSSPDHPGFKEFDLPMGPDMENMANKWFIDGWNEYFIGRREMEDMPEKDWDVEDVAARRDFIESAWNEFAVDLRQPSTSRVNYAKYRSKVQHPGLSMEENSRAQRAAERILGIERQTPTHYINSSFVQDVRCDVDDFYGPIHGLMVMEEIKKGVEKLNQARPVGAMPHFETALRWCIDNENIPNHVMALIYAESSRCNLMMRRDYEAHQDAWSAVAFAPEWAKGYQRLADYYRIILDFYRSYQMYSVAAVIDERLISGDEVFLAIAKGVRETMAQNGDLRKMTIMDLHEASPKRVVTIEIPFAVAEFGMLFDKNKGAPGVCVKMNEGGRGLLNEFLVQDDMPLVAINRHNVAFESLSNVLKIFRKVQSACETEYKEWEMRRERERMINIAEEVEDHERHKRMKKPFTTRIEVTRNFSQPVYTLSFFRGSLLELYGPRAYKEFPLISQHQWSQQSSDMG
eukprot:GHVN01035065.1.p2 GENE.GHVN01035065.1~~GHVN01035065.1.p2  ORF type:complete len:821 (-),score=133.87 GHVN01035065.1:1604-4066(-)